jgi:ubiquinone/menaquinone biosynthesis C-methylase UbiE
VVEEAALTEEENVAHRVCPYWLGYLLLNPLRRLRENPKALLAPWVREGMVVLEPGPGMGFFTLDLARMVGPTGKVVTVELQERMLARLRRRAEKKGLENRIDARLATSDSLGIGDLAGRVDLCVAIHVVHEIPDASGFFAQVRRALAPGGRIVLIEPRGHVSEDELEAMLDQARTSGFDVEQRPLPGATRSALLRAHRPEAEGIALVQ